MTQVYDYCVLWTLRVLLPQVATLLSSYEPEHPEEFRRRRIVGADRSLGFGNCFFFRWPKQ